MTLYKHKEMPVFLERENHGKESRAKHRLKIEAGQPARIVKIEMILLCILMVSKWMYFKILDLP